MGHGHLPSGRRWRVLVVLATLLVALVGPIAAAQSPTTFTAAAQAVEDGRRITLEGRLLRGEVPVAGAEVHVTLGAVGVGSTRTDGHGVFRLNLSVPADLRSGVQSVGLRFDGDAQFAPTSTTLPVVMGADAIAPAPDATTSAHPTAPPADLRPATALTLAVTPEAPRPGDLLTLTGRLTVADSGVPEGRIEVRLGGRVSGDSLTYTDGDGRFTTYLEVPSEHPAGAARVEVRFDGSGAHLGSSGTVRIAVREPLPPPSEAPTTTASPAPEVHVDHLPVQNATSTTAASTSASAAASASPAPATGEDGRTVASVTSPMSGVLAALVAVGGSSLLVTVALLIRRLGRSDVDDDVTPGFLTDAGGLWEDDALEATQLAPEPVRPEPAPRPRRGLPAD